MIIFLCSCYLIFYTFRTTFAYDKINKPMIQICKCFLNSIFQSRYYLLSIVCLGSFVSSNAQFLHSVGDFEQIMSQSSYDYTIDSTAQLKDHTAYTVIQKDSSFFLTTRKARKYHNLAIKARKIKNLPKARKNYLNALRIEPMNQGLLADFASLYEEMNIYQEAIFLYKKMLTLNPKDGFIRQKLALCLLKVNRKEKALEEILLAHLYNRNEKSIQKDMISILEKNGIQYFDWDFSPQYEITRSLDSTAIFIKLVDPIWKSYATCKAVWLAETNHSSTMQFISDADAIETIEEKECLFSLITSDQIEDSSLSPMITGLEKAVDLQMLDNFILYEKQLREVPEIALAMNHKKQQALINYILNVHTNGK